MRPGNVTRQWWELPRHRHESFSTGFYIRVWLGTSRSRLFHKPGRDDQFSFALRADVAARAQTGNTSVVRRAGENLRGRRAAGSRLLGRELLVARCMGAIALFQKAMRATCRDYR